MLHVRDVRLALADGAALLHLRLVERPGLPGVARVPVDGVEHDRFGQLGVAAAGDRIRVRNLRQRRLRPLASGKGNRKTEDQGSAHLFSSAGRLSEYGGRATPRSVMMAEM